MGQYRAILCAIFFASGASALIFEVLWFRQAGLAFGNSVWASSLVLSGFMGGLALGDGLAARYGGRISNPIRGYATAEVAIALSGVGLVYVLPVFGIILAPWLGPLLEDPWILNSIRLVIAFTLLLVPTTALGVTLPLLTKVLAGTDPNFGRVLGRLYGWNTLGAVIGVVIGETLLIRVFGVRGTALTAGALNLGAAAAAWQLSTRFPHQPAVSTSVGPDTIRWAAGRQWLIAAFLAGFCLLALEVVWFRFLLLFVSGHSLAFALMLGVVLSGIALGALAASHGLHRWPDAHRFGAPIAFFAGLLCVISYATFSLVLRPFGTGQLYSALDILHLGVPLMFPVCFLSGALFTLLGAALRKHLDSDTVTTGILTFANTTGAALGSLVGGFVLLPVLGIERSFFLIVLLYGGIGLWLLPRNLIPRRIAYATMALFLVTAALFPFGSMASDYLQRPVRSLNEVFGNGLKARGTRQPLYLANLAAKVVAVREGLTQTLIYVQERWLGVPAFYELITNSYQMAGTDYRGRRYMKLFVYWPVAVHPQLKHALLIAFGAGNTAKALTDTTSLETIDVVDISRNILELSDVVYPDRDNPLRDPRVRVHIEDGRYFLLTTRQRFDLITGEPPPPREAGVVNLYTRQYFQLLYDRLAEGGMVTYWLPIHLLSDTSTKAVLRAFCDVFTECSLWNGMGTSLMMVGIRNARGPVSEEQFVRQWNEPDVAGEMRRLGFERPEQLGALFIGDADYLNGLIAGSPPLVDNDPRLINASFDSVEAVNQLFQSVTDVAAAQERFRRSPLIKRLWPERLLTASLPYFEFQDMINIHFYGVLMKRFYSFDDVHRLLTTSSLSTLALWLLRSDSDIQSIVSSAGPQALANPLMQAHLGFRRIAERKYLEAVEPLSLAEQSPELRVPAFQFRIYALCMAGRTEQAQQLAQERLAQTISASGQTVGTFTKTGLPPFWSWMKKTFGIDPLRGL
jgi:spermidine synthase